MNTFGSSTYQYPLYDPRGVVDNRMRFRRDKIPVLDRANSIYIPSGNFRARGWLLMARADYNKLDTYSTTLQLNIGNPIKADNISTLKNLSIVQAQCVTRGLASDEDALYLVEITDGRGVLCNKWFQFPITTQYNIRAPAYPQTFHPSSMNTGVTPTTTWTWSTMLENIWNQMSTFLGTWPGLPSGVTPAGTPEGFWFVGVSAFAALCDVLDHLGLTIVCDLTTANPYTIVSEGATDTAFTALHTKYLTNLEDDHEWIDTGAGRVPKTIKVLFRRRNSVYGSEETVTYRNDTMAEQWNTESYYTVTVTAPTTFSSAVGTHYIWSDFTVRYDQDGNPMGDDTSVAIAIANERVTQYFDRIYRRTAGFMSRTYTGALPFLTGSQVDGVAYYQDMRGDSWGGWRTQIMRGMEPPWPELYGKEATA